MRNNDETEAAIYRGALIDFWVSVGILLAGAFLIGVLLFRPDPADAQTSAEKWGDLQQRFSRDMVTLILCSDAPQSCNSPAAMRMLILIEDADLVKGRASVGRINRSINLAIKAKDDASDYWASPLETFERGTGDCEDYAIAKAAALRMLGFKHDDLIFTIVRDLSGQDHALLSVRVDGAWLTLDNRRMAIAPGLPPRIVFSGSL